MSNAIYLKLEGTDGECQKEKHKNEIELLAFGWGLMNDASMFRGKGTADGICTPDLMNCTKEIDSSTPAILGHCASGKIFPEAIITLERSAGDQTVTALKITLKNAFVSLYSVSDSQGSGLPSENFSMSFEEIKLEYTGQEGTSAAGKTVPWSFNIKTGVME